MVSDFFNVTNEIVDRDDLTIYEKMCFVVLARYAGKDEFFDRLSNDIIAMKMGCASHDAEMAIAGLVEKDILEVDAAEFEVTELEPQPSAVIKRDDVIARPMNLPVFESIESKEQVVPKLNQYQKVGLIKKYIKEPIAEREIKIVLNMACGDVDEVKVKYDLVKDWPDGDLVDNLLHALQGHMYTEPDAKSDTSVKSPIIESETDPKGTNYVPVEDPIVERKLSKVGNFTQINRRRIADLYNKNKK